MKKIFLSLAVAAFIGGSISTRLAKAPDKKSVKARERLERRVTGYDFKIT